MRYLELRWDLKSVWQELPVILAKRIPRGVRIPPSAPISFCKEIGVQKANSKRINKNKNKNIADDAHDVACAHPTWLIFFFV